MALAATSLVVFCALMQCAQAAYCEETCGCHELAYCDDDVCRCPMGATGNGEDCVPDNVAVRYVIKSDDTTAYENVTWMTLDEVKTVRRHRLE
eukprot:1344927-Rhodomonas_salina.1